jgi:hypothetical protein
MSGFDVHCKLGGSEYSVGPEVAENTKTRHTTTKTIVRSRALRDSQSRRMSLKGWLSRSRCREGEYMVPGGGDVEAVCWRRVTPHNSVEDGKSPCNLGDTTGKPVRERYPIILPQCQEAPRSELAVHTRDAKTAALQQPSARPVARRSA